MKSSLRKSPFRRSLTLGLLTISLTAVALLAGLRPERVAAQIGEPPVLDLATYPRSTLTIVTAKGAHEFDVWIADNADRQRQGLMYVRDLPADQGMLFINEEPRVSSFWMKNTFIPLDMLFVDARGRIVEIFANTKPLSLEPVGASTPVLAILELRGGESARRGIRKGDRLRHPAFKP